jgi:putative endonuclease
MEEFVVYILFSKKYNKTYVGFTSSLIDRFKSHNELGTKGYTLKYRPWQVVYVDFFITKEDAIKKEKFFKNGNGRDFIKKLINNLV